MTIHTVSILVISCSLTPSTKRESQRGSLLKGVAVQGVLYQSILNAKLTGRKKLGRKMCTSNRYDRKLENTVKQSRFKHLRELHKEWTEAGVSASRVTMLRHLQMSKAGSMTMVLLCLIGQQTRLTWTPENLWSIVKSKMRDTRPNNTEDLKAVIKATWASITPEQYHRHGFHPCHDAFKYWVHRN